MSETTIATTGAEPVKIELLQIRNFKRVHLAEAHFSPDGLSIIGGRNGQGKSTFLHAIGHLLGGKKHAPSNPHNTEAAGATAVLRARLSNGIEVERSGKSGTLKVKVDGKKGNQTTLNEFLNEFALDISKFLDAKPTDKAKLLIANLGIGDQLEQLDQKEKHLCEERTIVGRDADRKKAAAAGMPTYDNAPAQRVDASALLGEMRRLEGENTAHQKRIEEMGNLRGEGMANRNKIDELRAEIIRLEQRNGELKARYEALEREGANFTFHDLAPLEQQLKDSESLNMMVDANERAAAAAKEAETAAKEYQDLTDNIEEARQQRTALLSSIEMPLPDLEIVEGELKFRGQLWDGMSGSEKLRVATAISRAFKPECGFVLVDELEQLDWQTVQEFDAWARSEGIQIIAAMVCDEDRSGENVIIIEDGRVKESA